MEGYGNTKITCINLYTPKTSGMWLPKVAEELKTVTDIYATPPMEERRTKERNYFLPQLWIDDCGLVSEGTHLAGPTDMVDGQRVAPDHAAPVVVRVVTVLSAQLGGRVRGNRPQ